jgi:predicted nucleic acid-binding Zn ribbon protein
VAVAHLSQHWAEVVGEQVADHSRPAGLRDGVLTVAVDHHAWASQLRMLSGDITRQVRELEPSVSSMVVHVSPQRGKTW